MDSDKHNFKEVDKILDEYGLKVDARMQTFYYTLVKLSRIINQRKELNEEDYDLLKWFIEKTNCKLDIIDTVNYNIKGPPDIKKEKKIELEIEKETKQIGESEFGIQSGEFE